MQRQNTVYRYQRRKDFVLIGILLFPEHCVQRERMDDTPH